MHGHQPQLLGLDLEMLENLVLLYLRAVCKTETL